MPMNGDGAVAPALRHAGVLYGAFAVALAYGMLIPLVPAYLEAGAGSTHVALHSGALAAMFMAGASVAAPFWGHLSDRIGRARVILAGLAGAAAAPVPFALSQGLPELYLFQGLAGVFFGAVAPVAAALLFEDGDPLGSGRRLALLGAATLGGYLAGPVLGGWMGGLSEAARDALPAREVVLMALAAHASVVGLAVPLAWAGMRFGPRYAAAGDARGAAPAPRSLGAVILALSAAMLAAFTLGGFEISTALHVRGPLGLGSRAVAAVFVACALGMLIAQLAFLPRLSLRTGRTAWAFGLLAGVAALLAGVPLAASLGATLATGGLIGAGLGLAIALLGLQTAAVAGRRRGLALGLQNSAVNAGQAIGSYSGGALFAWLAQGSFAALSLAIAAGTLLLALAARAQRARIHSNGERHEPGKAARPSP